MTKINEFPEGFDVNELYEYWLKVGRSTEPCDRPKMEAAVSHLYEFCGLKKPETFLWSASPLSAAITKLMYESMTQEGSLASNLGSNLWSNLESNLRSNLWSIWDVTGGTSWYSFGSIGTTAFWAYIDAGRRVGLTYPEQQNSALDAAIDLTECGLWFPYENVVIMCEKPIEYNLDAQGRTHNDHGPSMLFADDYALFNFHGVTIPKSLVEHPELITTDQIMKESNSEVRRVMCEIMGWDRFVAEAKLTLIDECDDPANAPHTLRLYDIPEQIFDVEVRLLLMVNATPKPSGIVPRYGVTVPVEIDSALAGAAWMADVPVEQYRQLVRAT